MKNAIRLVTLLVLFPASAITAQQANGKPQKGAENNKLMAAHPASENKPATTAAPEGVATENYLIGPHDVLSINVWKEPEVTQTVMVRPDRKISLPLVEDVTAAGLTPTQLGAAIAGRLGKFFSNPQVTVVVTQINSQRVYVLGEVNRAGVYTLFPEMTVLQALSNAGGFTAYADQKRIHILREENGQQQKFLLNYKETVNGRGWQQNIRLKTGDTIIVP